MQWETRDFDTSVAGLHRRKLKAKIAYWAPFLILMALLIVCLTWRFNNPRGKPFDIRCRDAGGTYAEVGDHDVCFSHAVTIPLEGGR